MTSTGDMDLLNIFFALLVARTSLLESTSPTVRTIVSYPSMYAGKRMLKYYVERLSRSNGSICRSSVTYNEVKNVNDAFNIIEHLDNFDVYIDLYFDYHLTTTSHVKKALAILNEKKNGRIIVINRFNRKKKTITDGVDGEMIVKANRSIPLRSKFFPVMNMMVGKKAGAYWLTTVDKKIKINYELKYPSKFL